MTPAYIAAQEGHVDVVQLLRHVKANLETPTNEGATPAYIAAQNGHVKVLQLLRDAKVNLETPTNEWVTPAYIAAQEGHVDVLQLLRNAGVDIVAPITMVSCAIISLNRPKLVFLYVVLYFRSAVIHFNFLMLQWSVVMAISSPFSQTRRLA